MAFGLLAGFAFGLLLLLVLLRWTAIDWRVKAGLTLLVLPAVWLFDHGLRDSLGWPATLQPAGVMRVLGADIREPTATSDGIIYLWYIEADTPGGVPRLLQMPYAKADQDRLAEATSRTAAGLPSYMRRAGKTQPVIGQGGAEGHSDGQLNFVPPPFKLPDKD